jgi:hypothetical protein
MNNEGTVEHQLKTYLSTLSTGKRDNIRKLIDGAPFQRLMEMVEIFKPRPHGQGPDNSNGEFCIMRLAEIRGWESYDSILKGIVNYVPAPPHQEIEEEFQPPQITTQSEET